MMNSKDGYYDPETAEAVISLESLMTHLYRGLRIINPMWLVNLSKKDVECLFYNKIWYLPEDEEQAMQYQKIINVFYEKRYPFWALLGVEVERLGTCRVYER
ncbi:hypothetical protein Hanom_Chr02g00136061 [Helianthus anomalus]